MPLGGLLVRRTIRRGLRNGGNEVTERLANGVYRVTRCDRAGALTSSMTVAPVRIPTAAASWRRRRSSEGIGS